MIIGTWYATVVAFTGAAGCAWVLSGVLWPVADRWKRRLGTFAVVLASALVLAVAARLWSQTHRAFGDNQPLTWLLVRVIVMETPWGSGWMWQATGAVSCLIATGWARRTFSRWPVVVTAAVATAFATSFTGHAVGMDEGRWMTVLAHGVHVVAAGLWLGTLATLLLVTRGVPAGANGLAAFAAAITRFSPLARAAAAVLVIGGVVAAWRHVGTFANLATPYGLVLSGKVAAFAGAAFCGWYNWRRVTPALQTHERAVSTLRRVAWTEVGLGVAAIALTAALGTLPMPGHDH